MDTQIVGMAETVAIQPLDTSVAVLVDLLAVIVKEVEALKCIVR